MHVYVYVISCREKIKEKSLKEARNLKIMFLLGAAWASNIGGTGISKCCNL
jgi:hypothetical protein